MPRRYTGGFLSAKEQATDANTANGIFTVQEAAALTTAGNFPTGRWTPQRSLRLESNASSSLSRTPGSAGNRQIFTYSVWVKLASIVGGNGYLISANTASGFADGFGIAFGSGQLSTVATSGNSTVAELTTTQVFRDPSAWYHIICAVDTTQSVASQRIKIYVNGSQVTSFSTSTYPSQNANFQMNNTGVHYIGRLGYTSSSIFDGYMSEINSIDGQALTPTSFGMTDPSTGTWVPKRYTGTYGTNGFYLPFSNTGTTAAIGLDMSPSKNIMTYSEQFDNAAWAKTNVTVTANAVNDPLNATLTADKIIPSATNGTHLIQESLTSVVQPSTYYTFAVYAKAAGYNEIQIAEANTTGSYAYFNLATGVVVGSAGSNNQSLYDTSASIENVGNGWYRCIVTLKTGSSQSSISPTIYVGNNGTYTYAGDTTSGIYLWGAQLNAGNFANTYVTTTSAGVTNNWTPNNITVSGGDYWDWDQMYDVPGVATNTPGRQNRGNYPTVNWNHKHANISATQGGLYLYNNSISDYRCAWFTTVIPPSGKYYWEVTLQGAGDVMGFGIGPTSQASLSNALTANIVNITGKTPGFYSNYSGAANGYFADGAGNALSVAANDVINFAYDAATGELWMGKNGNYYTAVDGNHGNTSAGTGRASRIVDAQWRAEGMVPYFMAYNGTGTGVRGAIFNFGQKDFRYTPPAGFNTLCTTSMPDPIIKRPEQHFDVKTYSGNGTQQIIGTTAKETSGYQINKSLRLRAINSTTLSRTPASASNRKTWTWSAWVKRGAVGTGTQDIFNGNASTGGTLMFTGVRFIDDVLYVQDVLVGTYNIWWSTNTVYRDPSAWYHIVVKYDTTQASSSNAVALWVNGVQQTLSFTANTGAYVQNRDSYINSANIHYLGAQAQSSGSGTQNHFDGYQAEVQFIDGQALTPTSFGIFDANNNWMPQRYTGTYGTNGFYLKFNDNSGVTAVTIGADTSGNSNNWTPNNLNVVANEYKTSQTWVAPTGVTSVDYLVVGGGGGGGGAVRSAYSAGGGGGGGRVLSGTLSVTPGSSYTITIGAGGTAGSYGGGAGGAGGSSVFASVTAAGGSGGSAGSSTGGSGGASGAGLYGGGSGASGFGGGGGGAGGTGGNYNGASGVGGAGVTSSISTFSVGYGGGGSGAVYAGIGGTGAPGAGGGYGSYPGQAGTANRGGGGGGGGDNTVTGYGGGAGGSGTVWLKWAGSSAAYSTTDAPTDTVDSSGNVVGNYATFNPTRGNTTYTSYSNSNLTALALDDTATNFQSVYSTLGFTSGKFYAEYRVDAFGSGGNSLQLGVGSIDYGTSTDNQNGSIVGSTLINLDNANSASRDIVVDTATTGYASATTWAIGDICGIAVDADDNKVYFYKNGTLLNSTPAALTRLTNLPVYFIAYIRYYTTPSGATVNFGQTPFAYTPPTGFKSLNTKNLKDVGSFNLPDTFGNFVNTPDFVWIKNRSDTYNHILQDTVRGTSNYLDITSSAQQNTTTAVQAFLPNGFQIGSISGGNRVANNIVAWAWNRGTTPGFDIVTYGGDGASNRVVPHNLGQTPAMIFVKGLAGTRSGDTWRVKHKSLALNNNLELSSTSAAFDVSSSTGGGIGELSNNGLIFRVGTSHTNNVNQLGTSYVAYIWAEVPGFSKFGSYVGNASTDGPFVYTGFRPKWLMIKRTDSTSNWEINDGVRQPNNPVFLDLSANLAAVENATDGTTYVFTANGFKITDGNSTGTKNISGGTYIYAAFAETPFKYANAR